MEEKSVNLIWFIVIFDPCIGSNPIELSLVEEEENWEKRNVIKFMHVVTAMFRWASQTFYSIVVDKKADLIKKVSWER